MKDKFLAGGDTTVGKAGSLPNAAPYSLMQGYLTHARCTKRIADTPGITPHWARYVFMPHAIVMRQRTNESLEKAVRQEFLYLKSRSLTQF